MTDFAREEYAALRAEERDRMNARLTVWTVYLSLTGAFSLAVVQAGIGAYLLALYPAIVACLALHTRHSEEVLKSIRKYLFQLEKQAQYAGYEHFTRSTYRVSHGGYIDALRIAFVLSQSLATAFIATRLVSDHLTPVCAALVIEAVVIGLTWSWLCPPAHKKPIPPKITEVKS
jgi:hypothetical protein